ncbi:hypothetical protein EYC84_008886 [Monilinia fructicola]|uniref:Uncharacterized protein n=1 Tax=Monilinia fructicola TaxID=38448 RepID=A0A5M9J9J9_MONFR|nr:hypothetical protein EYC84_008886 [Monilinia fructicola]
MLATLLPARDQKNKLRALASGYHAIPSHFIRQSYHVIPKANHQYKIHRSYLRIAAFHNVTFPHHPN